MNSDRIQSTLQSLFQDQTRWPHPHRRLIFWYDPEGQFQDTFNELELPAIEKLTLGDTPFTAKHRLLIQEPQQEFLLYAPYAEPAPLDNWLLDLQKSGMTFSADRAALLFADFGFNLRHLETVLRQHLKFFDHKKRSESLQAMQLPPEINEFGLQLALLSVLAGLKVPDPALLIRKVLMGGLLESENPLWQEIQKFVSTQAFWQVVKDHLGLKDPKPSLEKLARQLLITHLDTALHGPLPQNLESLVIAPGQRAYAFIDQWMRDQQDVSAWQSLSREIVDPENADQLDIFNQLETLPPEILQDSATFESIDIILIRQCVAELKAEAGNLKRWHSLIQARRTLVWFPDYKTTYDALEAAIALIELKRRYAVGFLQSAPQIFKAYATDLYQFDLAYRHFIVASEQAKPILREQGLIENFENLYANWFLVELSEAWSDSLSEDWQLEGIPSQTEFFRQNVTPILQRNDREKVFVLISDALRYEVASELAEVIEKELRGDLDFKPQFGVLPSITRLGMAALLPGKTLELIPGNDNVLRDGLNTQGTEAREQVLNKNSGVAATVLSATDLLSMTSEKGREAIKPYRLIYIYHDAIDGIGDKPAVERLGLIACDIAIQELLRLVKRLCNSLNATHVLITADHGFLYQRAEIDKLKLSKADDFLESGRRMVLRTETEPIEHTLAFKLPYESRGAIAVVPRGTLRFALQGRGAQFVHGGASLQEVCVPIITYRHKRAEKGDDGPARKVGVQVNARNRRVTNNRFSLNLMQVDAVEGRWRSRRVSVGLYDSSGQAITDIKVVELNSSSLQPSEREYRQSLTIAQSHPPTNAYLIVKDADDDTELVREDWTISLSIINDFGDF